MIACCQVEDKCSRTEMGPLHLLCKEPGAKSGAGEGDRTLDDLLGKKLVGTVVGKRTRKMP